MTAVTGPQVIMSTSPEIRINARLTGEDARHFRELQRREGLSASDLLREALREYHGARNRRGVDAAQLLARSGFVGSFDAPENLSENYKYELTEALERKIVWRVQEPKP